MFSLRVDHFKNRCIPSLKLKSFTRKFTVWPLFAAMSFFARRYIPQLISMYSDEKKNMIIMRGIKTAVLSQSTKLTEKE
jgi:hypothetical protein